MTVWSRVQSVGVVTIILVGYMLYSNPIRFHQTAHADGLTMQVPSTWTPMKTQGNNLISLRREWFEFLPPGIVYITDFSAFNISNGLWTMETARKSESNSVAFRSKGIHFSNASTFDLKAGDRTAVCSESTLNGSRTLDCLIVGTPLQFDFMGSRFAEPDAERMLASLN